VTGTDRFVADDAIDPAAQMRAPPGERVNGPAGFPTHDDGFDDREARRDVRRNRDGRWHVAGLLASQHGDERPDERNARGNTRQLPEEPTPGRDVRETVGHGGSGPQSSPMADPAGFYCDGGVRDEMRPD
jgi:hypothetical protein